MVREFFLRFAVVALFALGCSFLLVLFAISPSYFFARFQEGLVNDALLDQQNESVPVASQQAMTSVEDLNQKLGLIENAQENRFLVSEKVMNALLLHKLSDVKITQIFYEDTETEGRKILIRGSAPSRERLLLFRLALEDSLLFQKVELPISNFVKGANIEFSLNLVP